MHKRQESIRVLILVAAICLGAAACVRHIDDLSIQRSDMFWPNPPETRRIAFVNTISAPEDLNIRSGFLTKVFRYIGGTPAVSIVSPYGVSLDANGRLYVVDTFLRRVHVFDTVSNTYTAFPPDGPATVLPERHQQAAMFVEHLNVVK